MRALNPLEIAKQALLPSQDDEEQQRVLQLFRNRAELKKAYVELQDEIHRLKDRLKQQEGATARVRELLEQLEDRLGAVETGYPALVFYQLRRLWQQGSELLRAFGADLERQHVDRERRKFLAEVNQRQFARRQQAEGRLRDAEAAAAESSRSAGALARTLESLNRPWHHFKRRKLQGDLEGARSRESAAQAELADARAEMERVLSEGEVPFPGPSVASRRAVNVSVIAYAEVLTERLARTPLLALSRAAVLRREPSDEYGSRAECEALMADIARARATLAQRNNLAQEIRVRAERIARSAAYRGEDDTVPVPESVAQPADPAASRAASALGLAPAQGEARPAIAARPLNVLGDDLWDVFKALLR
jgi:hypothetical protein